jgi:hypothetical protein
VQFIELLSAAGLTAILMYGKPTEPIRVLAKKVHLESLFKCALCVGFWVGLLYAIALSRAAYYPPAVAGFCWAFDAIVNALREVYVREEKPPLPRKKPTL